MFWEMSDFRACHEGRRGLQSERKPVRVAVGTCGSASWRDRHPLESRKATDRYWTCQRRRRPPLCPRSPRGPPIRHKPTICPSCPNNYLGVSHYRRTCDVCNCLNSNLKSVSPHLLHIVHPMFYERRERRRHMDLTPAGFALDSGLDSLDVEALWQSGEYVDWQTGITMPEPPPASEGYEMKTHCSSFAAAAALNFGVPLLHPNPAPRFVPEKHLANAQAEWLQSLPQEWRSVSGPVEAQNLANQGYFVVISYLNPKVSASGVPESGHIQVVRAYPGRSDPDLTPCRPAVRPPPLLNHAATPFKSSNGYGVVRQRV
jgi:hypothetical protein